MNLRPSRDEEGQGIWRLSLTDVTELKKTQKALEISQNNLRHLTRQLITLQELERKRIAQDLHDELGQSLMVLKMQLSEVQQDFRDGRQPWEEFDQTINFINSIVNQVRELCQSLRPSVLENLGLTEALRHLTYEYPKRHGIKVTVKLDDLTGLVSAEGQIAVYRILQECLTNAARHSKATHIKVYARKGGGAVTFVFEDNGVGFDPTEISARAASGQGMGLIMIEERVRLLQGSFEIVSVPGHGTRVAFTLPLDKKNRHNGSV